MICRFSEAVNSMSMAKEKKKKKKKVKQAEIYVIKLL